MRPLSKKPIRQVLEKLALHQSQPTWLVMRLKDPDKPLGAILIYPRVIMSSDLKRSTPLSHEGLYHHGLVQLTKSLEYQQPFFLLQSEAPYLAIDIPLLTKQLLFLDR